MMIRGSVDTVTETAVTGWIYSLGRKAPITVQAILNHEILGDATASTHRPDLKEAGLGDGNSGFEIKLYRPIDPLYVPFLRVTVDGGDAELPRAPTFGLADFFRSLYAAHPMAGRHRSVFGGLWTDRTDAGAMLEGKVSVGQIDPEIAGLVADLIQHGFVSLPLAAEPMEHLWRESLEKQVGEVLIAAPTLELIRAAFEDNPMLLSPKWMTEGYSNFEQVSNRNPSTSPNECLEIIIPFGQATVLDLVRGSHELPEFTLQGNSRWVTTLEEALIENAVPTNRLLTRKSLHPGAIGIVSPGTIFRLRPAYSCLRVMCLPVRSATTAMDIEFGSAILDMINRNRRPLSNLLDSDMAYQQVPSG